MATDAIVRKALSKLALAAGGVASLAKMIGTHPPLIYMWMSGARKVPLAHVRQLLSYAKECGEDVRFAELRPDLGWIPSAQ